MCKKLNERRKRLSGWKERFISPPLTELMSQTDGMKEEAPFQHFILRRQACFSSCFFLFSERNKGLCILSEWGHDSTGISAETQAHCTFCSFFLICKCGFYKMWVEYHHDFLSLWHRSSFNFIYYNLDSLIESIHIMYRYIHIHT